MAVTTRVRLSFALLVCTGACASGECEPLESQEPIAPALERAGAWLAAFPETELRFDAAIGLHGILEHTDSPALQRAYERARRVADSDPDHLLHRLWNAAFTAPPEVTLGWPVPRAGEPRVNVNRVVIEALHCAANGLRRETLDYLAGPMRDGGGYHTTHALWALVIARENGCLASGVYAGIAADLGAELRSAQPAPFEPTDTLAVDLYAERLLVLVLSGDASAEAGEWARRLLELQDADGSWGVAALGEPVTYRYHATMMAAWGLAAWAACEG